MCQHVKLPDGNSAIICGARQKVRYCACGRIAELLCDWKVKTKKSGTCDAPVCKGCALKVGPDKHLCREHIRAYADWLKRHPNTMRPGQNAPSDQQMSLL